MIANYQKFLKGDLFAFKWYFRRDIYIQNLTWDKKLYVWYISRYNNIYYIFISKYDGLGNGHLSSYFPARAFNKKILGYSYYETFTLEAAPPISSRLVSRKIIKKYKEKTLTKFLKNPYKYVDKNDYMKLKKERQYDKL